MENFMNVQGTSAMTEVQQLRNYIAALEGSFARLQFQYNQSQATLTQLQYEYSQSQSVVKTHEDTILGLKEELECQKFQLSETRAKLQHVQEKNKSTESADFAEERKHFLNTIKCLTDKLDIQNQLIASLSKDKTSNDNVTRKDIRRSISELRDELRNIKVDVGTMKREITQKFNDAFVVVRRFTNLVPQNSRCGNIQLRPANVDRESLKTFCDEIEQISASIMDEIKNL